MSHTDIGPPGRGTNYSSSSRYSDAGHDEDSRSRLNFPPSSTQSQQDVPSGGQGMGGNMQRTVVRAACLNCRSAKRRCDGVGPVCGPCSSRGIDDGGCNFVSSKRGGPRYKGVKGAEAAKVKADRDRAREVARAGRSRKQDHETARSVGRPSDTGSTASQRSASPQPYPGPSSRASFSSGLQYQAGNQAMYSPEGESSYSQSSHSPFATVSGMSQSHMQPQTSHFGPSSVAPQSDLQHTYYPYQQNSQSAVMQSSSLQPGLSDNATAGLFPSHDVTVGSLGGPLSFANLELWQRIQEGASEQDLAAFTDFYSRLEMLPKAGIAGGAEGGAYTDPLDVLMDWEGGELGNNNQDNEQGVRTLLADYYEHVYPSCPVLLPSGHLPSLAFYFSGKGPCGLFASISAVVSLYLPPHEAVKTLKNSQAAMARLGGSPSTMSTSSPPSDEIMSTSEIAAYHAKTSEMILHQYAEANVACFIDATCPNPFAEMDEELITIEAAAAHTLLCHYYYGSGQPLSHQRAYKHAVEAWDLVQKLDLRAKSTVQDTRSTDSSQPNAARPFSSELKLEWAKRVYWASYAAATVMSCTGGFKPFGNPRDGVMDLKLRPHLEHDVAAWGVMVRGAQQVSRTYRLLFDLDELRARLATWKGPMEPAEQQRAAVERQTIFNAMLKLDSEIGTYTRFDSSWRNTTTGPEGEGMQEGGNASGDKAERELARSLKTAGRLMTSGALIILHRAQAFSNARVFMQPQCGIPEAVRAHKLVKHDVILHRAAVDEGGNGSDGISAIGMAGMQIAANSNPSSSDSSLHRDALTSTSSSSAQTTMQPHSFLTDRFAGGPFEPTHALERCRFAANTMIGTLPMLLKQQGNPKLPPYSACSFVLGAYSTLMLTLLMQVQGENIDLDSRSAVKCNGAVPTTSVTIGGHAGGKEPSREELQRVLAMNRAPVRDIITILNRFAGVWNKAVEYREEVSTLLAANEIIG